MFSWRLVHHFWTRFQSIRAVLCLNRRFSYEVWPTRRLNPRLCPLEGASHMSRDLHCPHLATAHHSFTLVIEINRVHYQNIPCFFRQMQATVKIQKIYEAYFWGAHNSRCYVIVCKTGISFESYIIDGAYRMSKIILDFCSYA